MVLTNLIEWNPWWEKKSFNELIGIRREKTKEILKHLPVGLIQVLAGVRRSGKSTILYQIINELLRTETDPKTILFINMEDETLLKADFDKIIEVYLENVQPQQKAYLFVDEIQNRDKWEFWIKKQYDLKKWKQIFISGSSSTLISSKYSSLLTGRQSSFLIYPLSFREFLQFKGHDLSPIIGRDTKAKIKSFLNEYLHYGGFPYIVFKQEKHHILVNYYNTIEEKDIILNHNLNEQKTKDLLRYLLTNIARPHTHKKLGSIIKASTTTISSYMRAFEKSFLLFQIPIFSYKIKDQLQYPRKIYCVDTGLSNIVGFVTSPDLGRLYENIVAVELKRRNKEFYYWKDFKQREVDFVIKEGAGVKQLIQVCYDISNIETKKRETEALLKSSKELKCKNFLVITEDYEEKETINNKKIHYMPLWKYLLEE